MNINSAEEFLWFKRFDFDGRAKGLINRVLEIGVEEKIKRVLTMLALVLLIGCTQSDTAKGHQESETANSQLQLRDLENLSGTTWSHVPMPPARVSITCSRLSDHLIISLDRAYLEPIIEACAPRPGSLDHIFGIRISYDGEIGRGMADLFARIHILAKEQTNITERSWPFILVINSLGGDALEAMLAGNIISGQNWKALVRGEDGSTINGRCYSACVLILAAATHRDSADVVRTSKENNAWLAEEWARRGGRIKDRQSHSINDDTNIGIHRLFIAESNASSVTELQLDLNEAIEMIGDYLAKHGVSRSLANDMMAIPSNDIRILTIDELNRYGLGKVNSAKADMERLELTRMCGKDYFLRREEYLRRRSFCMRLVRATEAGVADANHCIDDAKVATGLPDASCPDWIFLEH